MNDPISHNTDIAKRAVHDFWNRSSCGEELYLTSATKEGYEEQTDTRYSLEPIILSFADFESSKGKTVLEIGVGLGADHQMFAQSGAVLSGIDLTERAVAHTKQRLASLDLTSALQTADAENLPFSDNYFDIVYSWGVLHHSPDTQKAVNEVHRVLTGRGESPFFRLPIR
jgi:SAM-dependent methyltransferase